MKSSDPKFQPRDYRFNVNKQILQACPIFYQILTNFKQLNIREIYKIYRNI